MAGAAAAAAAVGGAVNAAASLAPLVLVLHVSPGCTAAACGPAARALLGLALSADALFNLLLGAGIAVLGVGMARCGRAWLGGLGVAAGIATIPVSLQVVSTTAARWLAVAAPLWLLFVAWSSALLWQERRSEPEVRHAPEAPLARAG